MTLLNSTSPSIPPVLHPRRPLLTPLSEPGHFLMVIDNSSLEKFTTCPLSAYYYLVLGREAHARNAALVFGGALHAGLESFYKGEDIAAQDLAVSQFFTKNPPPPDEYRTLPTALEVMRHYRTRATFPDYETIILEHNGEKLIEKAFEIPLGVVELGDNTDEQHYPAWIEMPWLTNEERKQCCANLNGVPQTPNSVPVTHIHIAWSGRIDLIAKSHGLPRIIDHKTTSIMSDQIVQDFQLSSQVLGYIWAAQTQYPSIGVAGFCVNFIHLKKPTGSAGLMDKGPRGGTPALNFERAYFQYSPERIAWWKSNTLTIVSDFIHCLVRNEFPSHTKWCFGKYGKCSYHDVCSTDSAPIRAAMINSDSLFKPVTWNPVADR